MSLTINQQWAATSFGRPIALIAGAGSGKTFTLKTRIANAFNPDIVGKDELVVNDINEVLAITFTEKAALELKSRIKDALRNAGLTNQALLVDGAWISTIHGMCSRILRENALTLSLDPAFSVIDEDESAYYRSVSFEACLTKESCSKSLAPLLGEYRIDTLRKMVFALIDAAVKSPQEFDSIEGPIIEGVAEKLTTLSDAVKMNNALTGAPSPSELVDLTQGDTFAYKKDGEPQTHPWAIEGKGVACTRDYPALNIRLASAEKFFEPLLAFAKEVYLNFSERKLAAGVFDNNDLLIHCYKALTREDIYTRYKDAFKLVVIDEFQDTDQMQLDIIKNFTGPNDERLCVVGDSEQSIYRFRGADLSVATQHLEELERTSEGPRESYCRPLDENFRSAEAVLSFVDDVFGGNELQTGPFQAPSYYQKLHYARNEEEVKKPFTKKEGPRVQVLEIEHTDKKDSLARRLAAKAIASRFAMLNEAGRSYGDMVILLGSMTHADDYAQALFERKIPCAITGGSVLSKRADALVLASLLRVLANPKDSEALLGLLSSDIFGFEAADFMALDAGIPLSTKKDDGESEDNNESTSSKHYGSIGDSFARLIEQDIDDKGLVHNKINRAVEVMRCAYSALLTKSCSRVIEQVLVDSGWIQRMQKSDVPAKTSSDSSKDEAVGVGGRSRVADALKIIRMIKEFEKDGTLGANTLANRLDAHLELTKETPGVLSAKDNSFVRIMTFHASKGLEFPIVAVGEIEPSSGGDSRTGKLKLESMRGKTYVGIDLDLSLEDGELIADNDKVGKNGRNKAQELLCKGVGLGEDGVMTDEAFIQALQFAEYEQSPALRWQAIVEHDKEQEAEELERKLYVAFTRAKEALIVVMRTFLSATVIKNALKALSPEGEPGSENGSHVVLHDLDATAKGTIAQRIHDRRDTLEAHGVSYIRIPWAVVAQWDSRTKAGEDYSAEEAIKVASTATHGEFLDYEEADTLAAISEEETSFLVPQELYKHSVVSHAFSPIRAKGIFSASSLHSDVSQEHAPAKTVPKAKLIVSDEEDFETGASATERGSAFHVLAELAVRAWQPKQPLLLDKKRISAVAKTFGLSGAQEKELECALDGWLASDTAQKMVSHAELIPEAPFTVALDLAESGRSLSLTGFIDLLAYDEFGQGSAFVVDYKTGRYLASDAARREAYAIQAKCYAYALLLQGFSEVSLTFVFVDQLDEEGRPALCSFPASGEAPYTKEALRTELLSTLGL